MTAPITLRRWQAEAIPVMLADMEAGRPNVLHVVTGGGKSTAMAEALRRWRASHGADEGAIVVTTPTRKLVEQLAATFRGVLGDAAVGMYYTRAKQDRRDVVVCCNASVPALAARFEVSRRKVALWIADEVHRAESDQVRGEKGDGPNAAEIMGLLKAERRYGVSATPFRSDEDDTLTMFSGVSYVYSPADALRDGVIVPTRYVLPDEGGPEIDVDTWVAEQIRAMGGRATRGPGAVDAASIADAEAYVETLARHGLTARAIHSRQADAEQKDVLRALEAGELDCVVHVSMLVEGVDMPWLRWLAVRRLTGSRIRWIQQVGRVIRSAPGKREAVVLDPHAQSMDYSPTYAASLGWPDREAEARAVAELMDREKAAAEDTTRTPEEVYVARVGAICRYLRQLRNALASEGVGLDAARERGSRSEAPTDRQIVAMRRMRGLLGRVVEEHRPTLVRLVDLPGVLTLGSAGDLLDLMFGFKSVVGEWGPASTVPLPPEAAFAVVRGREHPAWCAVAIRGPRVAGVVIRDGETLAGRVRAKVKGDTTVTVLTRLVESTVDRYGAKEIRVSDATVARGLAVAYPGVRYVEGKDNPAQSRAWALMVKAEREEGPVKDTIKDTVKDTAPAVPYEVPPPSDADAPLFGGKWAAMLAPRPSIE